MRRLAKLRTHRLLLNTLGEGDAEEFFSVVQRSRDHLQRWLPWVDSMQGVRQAEAFLAAAELQADMENGGLWGIFYAAELIGAIQIHWIDRTHACASLGYWLCATHLGQGYATEAMTAMLCECFGPWALHRVEASAAVQNQTSQGLLLRLGFLQEGIRRQAECLRGQYHDLACYGLLATDFALGSRCNQKDSLTIA